MKPQTVTLPYPILPSTIKATLNRKEGVVDVVMDKALNDIWPEDVAAVENGMRLNAETIEPWTDDDETIAKHVSAQLIVRSHWGNGTLSVVREIIGGIFCHVMEKRAVIFCLQIRGNCKMLCCCWYIRVHLPIRVSPQGTPILIVSALDTHHCTARLKENDALLRQHNDKANGILNHGLPKDSPILLIPLKTMEQGRFFSYVLRYNSTKMEPTTWQKENLPQGESSPWLATFLRPLYSDSQLDQYEDGDEAIASSSACCARCRKDTSANPKRCSRCKSVSYCSAECQRADWIKHKVSCSNKGE